MTHDSAPDQAFYTASEFAEILAVHTSTVTRQLEDGTLRGQKVGRDWQIPRSELARLVAGDDTVLRWRLMLGELLGELKETARAITDDMGVKRYLLATLREEEPPQLPAKTVAALARHLAAARRFDQANAATPLLLQVLAGGAQEGPIAWAKRRVQELAAEREQQKHGKAAIDA